MGWPQVGRGDEIFSYRYDADGDPGTTRTFPAHVDAETETTAAAASEARSRPPAALGPR
jgi:hypothetical protein